MAFPIGLVLFTASTLWQVYRSGQGGKDRSAEGYGAEEDFNRTDPNLPIGMGWGRPIWEPDVLFDFAEASHGNEALAIQNIEGGKVRRFVGMSLGGTNEAGIDGRDLSVWLDDEPLYETVDDESSVSARTLTPLDATRKVWLVPKSNVVPESVTILFDGVPVSAAGIGAGTIVQTAETTVTDGRANARTFTSADDPAIPAAFPRYGGYFPVDGIGHTLSVVKLHAKAASGGSAKTLRIGGTPPQFIDGIKVRAGTTISVPVAEVHIGKDKDGRAYWWVNATAHGAQLDYALLTYTLRPEIKVELKEDGSGRVTFAEAVPEGVAVTWTGKTSALQANEIELHLRDGKPDQPALPFQSGGARHSFGVGSELIQGVVRSYTTVNEVDDFEVVIDSGQDGFADRRVTGKDAGEVWFWRRHVSIRIRKNGASDAIAPDKNPANGWVQLWDRQVEGRVTNGAAQWFFKAGLLLAAVQGKTPSGQYLLERAKYDVEVVSAEAPPASDTVSADLFLGAVTETRHVPLSLPHHATLTAEITNTRHLSAGLRFRVGCALRRVWVPAANAAYDATTGRPQPGSWQWTRNHVWCACDAIVDPIFGFGEFFTWKHIRLARAIQAAAFCDAQTRKHADTTETETRSELDTFMRRRQSVLSFVRAMLRPSMVAPSLSNEWVFIEDADAEVVEDEANGGIPFVIGEDDVRADTLRCFYPSLEDLWNVCEFNFNDEEQDQRLVPDRVILPGAEPDQQVIGSLDLSGCRRWTQGARVASLTLQQRDKQRLVLEFDAKGWRLFPLEAGDIVLFTHPDLSMVQKKFRVEHHGRGSSLDGFKVRLAEHVPAVYASGTLAADSGRGSGPRPDSPAGKSKHGKSKPAVVAATITHVTQEAAG